MSLGQSSAVTCSAMMVISSPFSPAFTDRLLRNRHHHLSNGSRIAAVFIRVMNCDEKPAV
jgi:hypothetical protein